MPESWTHWECCTCHKAYDAFDEAERCETEHIVKRVNDNFAADLKDIMQKRGGDASW